MTSHKTNLSYISLPILGLIKFFTIDVRFANDAIERTLRNTLKRKTSGLFVYEHN